MRQLKMERQFFALTIIVDKKLVNILTSDAKLSLHICILMSKISEYTSPHVQLTDRDESTLYQMFPRWIQSLFPRIQTWKAELQHLWESWRLRPSIDIDEVIDISEFQ